MIKNGKYLIDFARTEEILSRIRVVNRIKFYIVEHKILFMSKNWLENPPLMKTIHSDKRKFLLKSI